MPDYSVVRDGFRKFFSEVVCRLFRGLTFLPLGIYSYMGYRLRRSQSLDLPEWSEMNWPELFLGGLRVFALLVLFVGAPLILGWILSLVLYFLTFGLLGVVAYLPLAITGFFAPMFFLSSFMAYLKNEEFQDALQFRRITQQVIHGWKPLALPIVSFWGIFLLALPIYGLFFLYRSMDINCLCECFKDEEFFLTC